MRYTSTQQHCKQIHIFTVRPYGLWFSNRKIEIALRRHAGQKKKNRGGKHQFYYRLQIIQTLRIVKRCIQPFETAAYFWTNVTMGVWLVRPEKFSPSAEIFTE